MNLIISRIADSELVQLYISGNTQAMEELLFRHKDRIYTAIYTLVQDKYLAEDLFQDTFVKIINCLNAGHYSEQGKFLPWAMRLAHNLCMDHYRKIKNKVPISYGDISELTHLIPNAEEAEVLKKEAIMADQSVRKLIEFLPQDQKEVIVLRMFSDLSFKEIANITGVSINTALGRMRYGLINLRKMMKEHEVCLR